MLISAMLPGVRAKATGLPRSSARQWILHRPPRERPIASCHSPFLSQLPNGAPSHGCCRRLQVEVLPVMLDAANFHRIGEDAGIAVSPYGALLLPFVR